MAIIRRNDPTRLLMRRLLLVALLGAVAVGLSGVWNIYKKERESRDLRTQAENQLADLSQREGQLNANIAKLQTARGMEEALREEYSLAARGEGLIVIVDQPAVVPTAASSSAFAEWLHKAFPWW